MLVWSLLTKGKGRVVMFKPHVIPLVNQNLDPLQMMMYPQVEVEEVQVVPIDVLNPAFLKRQSMVSFTR